MTSPSAASSADLALGRLAALPKLDSAGLSFTAISPGATGGYEGFDIKLTVDAQESVAELAEATRAQLMDATLMAYGPAVQLPSQHWMYVTHSEAATLTNIEDVVKKQDLLPFGADENTISDIKMIAARFTMPDKRAVTFYRVADSMLQFKKSKFLGLMQEGDLFGRLDPANILLMRTDFEVVVIDGYAFFARKSSFERAFGFLDKLRAESKETFNTVTSKLKIQGIDELREACTSQTQMMAKMSSIKRSMDVDPAYASAMTMARLIEYVEKHEHIDIDIVGTGEQRLLVFDPKPARRFQILKLLDDDFLHSVLTERDYEAGSKVLTG